jgi:predicted GNAT family N-acyltransferase
MPTKYRFQEESAMDLRSLRFLVLWPHKISLEECVLERDFEEGTRHFSARDENGELVSCCTVMQEVRCIDGQNFPLRLRAMAAHPSIRRKGVSKMLLAYVEQSFPEMTFWCDAREVAVPFYLRCGWEVKSDVYEIPIIGAHYLMVRK